METETKIIRAEACAGAAGQQSEGFLFHLISHPGWGDLVSQGSDLMRHCFVIGNFPATVRFRLQLRFEFQDDRGWQGAGG